ncbi:ribonuclease III [Plantactinospora sp. CA-290183]|uniref:ribonuclease III n=1 Tax=Plantactinospora sp. CA-290183 TaxID=3240006 RepID=UPI003D942A56
MTKDKRRRPPTGHLETAFGVALDPELLERALTHRSFAYENGGLPTNERLEFLGDSVLGVVITTALFHNHPDLPEGQLAKLRASVVNMRALADVARRLGPEGLGPYLLLGKGEETTGGRDKASILADTLEALLGAIYLQYGLDTVAIVIHRLFDPLMAESAGRGAALDWKTSLQELTAALGLGVPEYRIDEAGPDHAKTFTAWVVVAGRKYGGAEGRSKKEAEQRAAEAAWRTLSEPVAEPAVVGGTLPPGATVTPESVAAPATATPDAAALDALPVDGPAAPLDGAPVDPTRTADAGSAAAPSRAN